MKFLSCFLVVLILAILVKNTEEAKTGRKLFMILLDGFKWDYLSKFQPGELKGFEKLKEKGAYAERFIPEFPSLSFVNYYSIATGLHPESHGIIDNFMYDTKYKTEFLIGENTDQYHPYWWDDGEPVWITAKKQGLRSYFWYWCGCEVEIRGYRPDYCIEYLTSPNPSFENFTKALTEAVEILRNESSDIVGVYLEQVDHWGHVSGPNSEDVKAKIRLVDAQLLRIQNLMETTPFASKTSGNMFDNTDLVVFADHGMVERVGGTADNATAAINIYSYINRSDVFKVMGSKNGPIVQIWPVDGKEEEIYNKLKSSGAKMTVYKKADIPDKYHLKGHYRVAPIYLVANVGYAIRFDNFTTLSSVGFHGYDNAVHDLHGIFMARGPDFKMGGKVTTLPNIDIYEMLCNILGITPSPNNGTVSNTCGLLADKEWCSSASLLTYSLVTIIFSMVVKLIA